MHWHIALTQPGQDKTATANLQGRGYRVYYPVFPKQVRTRRNRFVNALRPLFPRYLFVQHGANQDWSRLRTSPGVQVIHSLLMMHGALATVSEGEVEFIRETEKRLCEQPPDTMKPHRFKRGDTVRINVGQFADFLASIEELDDDERNIQLLTYLFGRQVRVRAKPEHLTAIA